MSRIYKGVQGGTPTGKPLCLSCRNFRWRSGAAEGQEQLFCTAMGKTTEPMRFLAYDCSAFSDKAIKDVYQMTQRAYIVTTDGQVLASEEYYELAERGKLSRKERRAMGHDVGFVASEVLNG